MHPCVPRSPSPGAPSLLATDHDPLPGGLLPSRLEEGGAPSLPHKDRLAPSLVLIYCENMKNITVTVSDDLYKAARLRAAERQSTVSALVRGFLEALTNDVSAHERLRREQNEIIARIRADHPDFGAGDRLSRDEIHRRDAIR